MTEKKLSAEEVLQRIDQLLVVLKEISQDLTDISRSLKAAAGPSPVTSVAPSPAPSMAPAQQMRSIEDTRTLFPRELENLLHFEETPEYIIIKPRQFLGSENFGKVRSIVIGIGGEYKSAGKESHFRVSRQVR